MIAEHLSVEEVEVIRDMFSLMDTDNDGKVSFEELKAGLKKVGSQLAEPEMKMLMEVVNFYDLKFKLKVCFMVSSLPLSMLTLFTSIIC